MILMKELSGKKRRGWMKRYICDGIVKGATHVRNQMPCQDNKKIVEISDKIAIVAVADGHGSAKCPRSDRGSMIAVNSFYKVMKSYLKAYGEEQEGASNLLTFLNREGDMRFAQDVCEEWQARVKQSFYKNKVDGMTDADGNIKWSSVFSLYGTTLLGMLITDSFVFSFQIGDTFPSQNRCLEKGSILCTQKRNGKRRILYVYSFYRWICQQLYFRCGIPENLQRLSTDDTGVWSRHGTVKLEKLADRDQ